MTGGENLFMTVAIERAFNFNAGPSALPFEVLQQAQAELPEFQGTGMSIMEMSHRSKNYEDVHRSAMALMAELYGIPDNYKVLFLQGGASMQFAMIPLNFLAEGKVGAYVKTGSWAKKAVKEAQIVGTAEVVASSELDKFKRIPDLQNMVLPSNTAYLHITSNETIEGTQFQTYPAPASASAAVPLIADMSSDILSRPVDVSRFGLIYAGAQKNVGPSGVTVVIIREDLAAHVPAHVPSILRYSTHAEADSLYNTPPTYAIYLVNLTLGWLKRNGGIAGAQARNARKARTLYDVIDESNGFYVGFAEKADRSQMNVTFNMRSPELEKKFVQASEAAGFVGLKGHRSVGGLRASIYNAVPQDSVDALAMFMQDFMKRNI
jgi:phosphoserine aminotransferase